MTTHRCINPVCRGDDPPREVWDAAYLCGPCRHRLSKTIAELPGQYDDLALRLTTRGSPREPLSGSRETGLDLNEAVAATRDDIAAVLRSWARVVVEDRGLHAPRDDSPHSVAAWLLGHVDWLAHQPFADYVHTELTQLRRRAWALAYPSGRRHYPVAPCPAHDCDGTLWTCIAAQDDLLPSTLDCDMCELSLFSDRWVPVLVKGRAV